MSPHSTAWKPSLGAWPIQEGISFKVWAPDKGSVEVQLEKPGGAPSLTPLVKMPDGTFEGVLREAKVGDLYRYRVDKEGAYPDPASRYQPRGVHGPSQIVDPSQFLWTDQAWRGVPLEDLIVYELHVGTFSPEGTFDGVREHLNHLRQLGVTAIELMPLADFAGSRNWGYDGVAPFAPARCYGKPDNLRRLVDSAHEMGLAVLVDVVYNHLGPDGNYTGTFSSHYIKARQTAWGSTLNFDEPQNASVRHFFIQNALHWIHEYHMDGLRLDATHAIEDSSARHFLADLTTEVHASETERAIHIMAEDCRNIASLLKPLSQGGEGLTAVWSDDFHHQVRRMMAGDHDGYFVDFADRLEDLVKIINQGWLFSGQPSIYFKGPRGTDSKGLPLERFVFFIQNHDQIGNRAMGDRLHRKLDMAEYRAVTALLFSIPETPLLFMGQEWASSSPFLYFTDHQEELGKLVRQGRTKEFKSFLQFSGSEVPDPQAIDTFSKSKLDWSEPIKEPFNSVWEFYQALIKWRKAEFGVAKERDTHGSAFALDKSTLLLRRFSIRDIPHLVIIKFKGGGTVDLENRLEANLKDVVWEVLLTSEEKTYAVEPQPPTIRLSGSAPWIEFARPGAVILKSHSS